MNEIRYPTREEKKKSIRRIVDQGLSSPQGFFDSLGSVWHSIGLRWLFFGVGDCTFLAILGSALCWTLLFASSALESQLSVLLFFASPLLYGLLHLLVLWKKVMQKDYELLMTCRCSLKQMTIFRMLFFGAVSVALLVPMNLLLQSTLTSPPTFIRLLSISFSGLFLYAALELISEWKGKAPLSFLIAPALWVALFTGLLLLEERAEQVMKAVPTAVFLLVAISAFIAYWIVLRRFYFEKKEGGLAYAVG